MPALKPLCLLGTAALVLAACGGQGDKAAAPDPAMQAKLASLPAPYNTADLDNGKAQFAQCRSCHTIAKDGANMVGPNLHGMFGSKAGSKADYKYSEALKNSAIVWDASHLNDWIANPQTYLPGTKMTFAGVADEKKRIDLIAYLKVESGYAP
jgi:cytochrome c